MNKIPLKAKKIKIKIYVNEIFCIFIMIFFIIIRSIKEKFSILPNIKKKLSEPTKMPLKAKILKVCQ